MSAAGAPSLAAGPYPLTIGGRIDEGLTRWMWLVKWLLAIPHFFVLVFLWTGFPEAFESMKRPGEAIKLLLEPN